MTSTLLLQTLVVSCIPLLLAAIGGIIWRWVTKDRRQEAVEARRSEARTRQIEADVSAQIRDSLVQQIARLTADREGVEREMGALRAVIQAHEQTLALCRQETIVQKAELAMQAAAISSSVAKIAMLENEITALKQHLVHCPNHGTGEGP